MIRSESCVRPKWAAASASASILTLLGICKFVPIVLCSGEGAGLALGAISGLGQSVDCDFIEDLLLRVLQGRGDDLVQ